MMTDEEFVLKILQDGKPHSGEQIRMQSFAQRGHGLTTHSRISSLRNQGWIIHSQKIKGSREYAYWLEGKGEPRKKPVPPVQGYIFSSVHGVKENERICEIVERVVAEDGAENLQAQFKIRFGNGDEMVCFYDELHPWFPS